MTPVVSSGRAAAMNPLKQSPALGGAMAFLGIERCLPLLHGSQGCTAFALVLMVRHFREAIPLQTTAMSELSTILGGAENVETAIQNIWERAKPRLIGICSTALTETRGEDMMADLRDMRERHPEWQGVLDVVFASTPDYGGSLEEGWGKAVTALIEALVSHGDAQRTPRRVNLLPGSHLTPGDVEELTDLIEGVGLAAVVLPDLSRSLDGHVPDGHVSTSLGGTPLEAIAGMGRAVLTLAIGEQMRGAAEALLGRTGVPYQLFDHLTGLAATDAFVAALIEAGGEAGPRLKHERSRLIDAMLDGHFSFAGKRIGIAAEPDLLLALTEFATALGTSVHAAVSPVAAPCLARVPAPRVVVGDLADLEQAATGCDLLIANSHAREAAARLGVPLYRAGFPVFDRLGVPQRVSVGYRGTRRLIFEIANLFLEQTADTHGTEHAVLLASTRREHPHAQAQAG
jgi:nitrogenase molybdenum-iron protein NifN